MAALNGYLWMCITSRKLGEGGSATMSLNMDLTELGSVAEPRSWEAYPYPHSQEEIKKSSFEDKELFKISQQFLIPIFALHFLKQHRNNRTYEEEISQKHCHGGQPNK